MDTVELEITGLAAGGDGVARHEALAVFVPRTAPGDVVRATFDVRGRFARGSVQELVRAAPDRVDPPCVHYVRDGCGGCQWQHLAITAQRAAKAQLVADAFRRIAHRPIAAPPVTGDDAVFGYRRTISVTVRGDGARRIGGFHAIGAPDVVVPIERCLIAHDDVQAAWDVVRHQLRLLPRTGRQGPGARDPSVRRRRDSAGARDDLRVTIRRFGDGEVALVVDGGSVWRDGDVRALAARVPRCGGVWWRPADGAMRLVWSRDAEPREPAGAAHVHDPHRDDALTITASFVQVNAGVASLLHAHVLDAVRREAPRHVVDAYAGTGRLARALAADGVRVTAIEWDARASAWSAARLPDPSRALAGAVEERLGDALPADVVVLNPPRGGVDRAVTGLLHAEGQSAERPRLLVYVSCDPATLARDVARLGGWRVDAVHCFDMFPQTAHVETVCLLRPEAA